MDEKEIDCTRCGAVSLVKCLDNDYHSVSYCPCCGDELLEELDFSE